MHYKVTLPLDKFNLFRNLYPAEVD